MHALKIYLFSAFVALFVVSCKKETCIRNSEPEVDPGRDTVIALSNLKVDSFHLNGKAFDKDGTVESYL